MEILIVLIAVLALAFVAGVIFVTSKAFKAAGKFLDDVFGVI